MADSTRTGETFCHPTAPVSWSRDAVPHARHKPYSETRPGDFNSLREVPERKGLLRLVIGRLITADGHDLQDDYTVPIEEQFLHKPLGWILSHTYCPARGIRDARVQLSVRFMLAEAGSGLGWMDVGKSPRELQLKDTDIMEVLVTRQAEAPDSCEAEGAGSCCWSPTSWREAVEFFEETRRSGLGDACRWLPKAWRALEACAEDDNVVVPGLDLLASFLQHSEASPRRARAQQLVQGRDSLGTLQRILRLHSRNAAVQRAGWGLVAGLAAEPLVQPLLVQRGGIWALATRVERKAELGAEAMALVAQVVQSLAAVPKPPSGVPAGPNPSAAKAQPAKARGETPRAPDKSLNVEERSERSERTSTLLVTKLQRAVREGDTLVVDKTLRLLLQNMRALKVDSGGLQRAGLGPLLRELQGYEGDADIRDLAHQAVAGVARLQQAELVS